MDFVEWLHQVGCLVKRGGYDGSRMSYSNWQDLYQMGYEPEEAVSVEFGA